MCALKTQNTQHARISFGFFRLMTAALVLAGFFFLAEAKSIVPDVQDFDIDLTTEDINLLYDRDEREYLIYGH